MSKYKYGIFDVDGNLIDSMPLYTKTFSRILLGKFRISAEESSKYYLTSAGTPLDIQFGHMMEKNGKSIKEVEIQSLVEEFFGIVNQANFRFYNGAKELMLELRKKGFVLFVTTGSQTSATGKKLEKAGIADCFKLILGSSEVPKGPEHIKKFSESATLPIKEFSSQAFYCADGAWDMEVAKMFGISDCPRSPILGRFEPSLKPEMACLSGASKGSHLPARVLGQSVPRRLAKKSFLKPERMLWWIKSEKWQTWIF